MFRLPFFFYNDDAPDGGTGGGNPNQPDNQTTPPVFTPDELKEFGYESIDALKEGLRRQKSDNVSPEEKAKKEQVELADFLRFSTERDLMKVDDYNQFQQLKGKSDNDLVFNKFKAEFLEDEPDANEEDIKTAFELEYKITSENEKTKARGNARLQKEAKEIRSPFETSYNTAKSQYEENKSLTAKVPEFNKFIEKVISENTPEKMTFFKTKVGEEEIPIDVELSAEEKKELTKLFSTPKYFKAFLDSNGKTDDLSQKLSKKINGILKEKHIEAANQKIWETAHGIGVKSGSTVGAENLYGTRQTNINPAKVVNMEGNEKASAARERVRSGR